MVEISLKARTPLAHAHKRILGVEMREDAPGALYSLARPKSNEAALDTALQGLGLQKPEPGRFSKAEGAKLIWMAFDQYFLLLDAPQSAPDLQGAAYITDQTHGWAALRLTGPRAVEALERICPLDLHDSAFPVGAAARTSMEHLGVIIMRDAPQSYLLMSARSSARDFLHAIETSLRNIA